MDSTGGAGKPGATATYREAHTRPTFTLLIFALVALYAVVTIGAIARHKWSTAIWVGIVGVLLLAFLINFARLTFEITADEVIFGFGLVKKRLPRAAVTSCEPYELKYGNTPGYLMSRGLDNTVAYKTRNGAGVKITMEGAPHPYVVSVDEPAFVCKVLG